MREDCLEAVSMILGKSISKGQGDRIEGRVRDAMKQLARENPEEWRAKTYTDRLMEAAGLAAQQMKEDLARKRRNVELQIAAHDRIENHLANVEIKKAGDALRAVSQILAFDTKGGGFRSVDSTHAAIRAEAWSNLRPLWESVPGNFFGLFENKQGVADLWKELHGEDSGNATAKKGAEAWRKVTEELRNRFNDAGGQVGKLEDWYKPQHHSQYRVGSVDADTWINSILPLLDRQKYVRTDGRLMGDEEMHNFLGHAYDSIITDGQNSRESGSVSGTGVIANRNAAHRQIFFKDADSAAKYQKDYGEKSLVNVLTAHINRMSRDIALAERLGPNSDATFRYFNDRATLDEKRSNPTKAAAINKAKSFNEAVMDAVSGKDQVVDQRVANAFQGFRNYMTATKLAKVVITALSDEAGMMSTAFANKVPYTEMLMQELRSVGPTAAREFGEEAALGMDAVVGHMNRFAQEEFNPSFSGKMASNVMRLSGAERMWAARRQGVGVTLMASIGRLTRKLDSVDKLSVEDHGVLAGKGISDAEWQVWRRANPENFGGKSQILTPKSIWAIPDAKLADLGDPRALKRQATTALLSHVLEEAGMGAMDSGPRQRVAMSFGTKKGTYGGELMRSVMLFKGFTASMMMKHWNRAAMQPGFGKVKYAAPLFIYSTLIAAAGNQIRNIIAGKDPEDMRPSENPMFWGKAFLRGGGMGFFGDFLYGELTQQDTSLTAALGGPLVTTAEDIAGLTHGAFFQAKAGKQVDEKAKLIRFAKSNIPFLNMWYTQAAADHLIWNHLQEIANPGYLARMQARQESQYGQTYWWKPGENVPHQAPDLAKAVGSKSQAQFAAE